jgi:hypothetical protein
MGRFLQTDPRDVLLPEVAFRLSAPDSPRGKARSTWGAGPAGFLTCWPTAPHTAPGLPRATAAGQQNRSGAQPDRRRPATGTRRRLHTTQASSAAATPAGIESADATLIA